MKKHLLLPIVILLLLSLFQACTDQDQAIEPEQPIVEVVLLTEDSRLQNLVGKINQQGSMNGRSNSFLDEVNFERAMKRFNPETGNTHYSFSMHSDSGLTLRKFILSENSENEISGHVFEYEVDADWLAEVEIFPGWHQYNGYFRILDLDGEVIAENEIVAGSSVSKESSNGRSSGYICITTTRRIGWVGVHPDYMEARYETTTNCFTITNRGTPAPTGGGGSGLLQISQEVGFLTSSRDDFPLNTCSADNTKYENGTCVCINGYIKDENDNCVSRLPCAAGYVRDENGDCISAADLWEANNITLSTSFRNNPCAKGVYDQLMNSNEIYELLSNFLGETPTAQIEIDLAPTLTLPDNQGATVAGKTHPQNSNGIIRIEINKSYIEQGRSNLEVSRTISHEFIHAEIFRKTNLYRGTTTEFWELYKKYYNSEVGSASHNYMTEYYLDELAAMMLNFDSSVNSRDFGIDMYKSGAWIGLEKTDAWNLKSPDKQNTIKGNQQILYNGRGQCN